MHETHPGCQDNIEVAHSHWDLVQRKDQSTGVSLVAECERDVVQARPAREQLSVHVIAYEPKPGQARLLWLRRRRGNKGDCVSIGLDLRRRGVHRLHEDARSVGGWQAMQRRPRGAINGESHR